MITHLVEHSLESGDSFSKLRNKISYLMVESFQNIVRHGDNLEDEDLSWHPGIFFTRNIGSSYYIISANIVDNQIIPVLKEKLDNVNTLDQDELKALYYSVLTKQGLSNKGGAGLGLIQMARKSGQKLEFDFVKLNDKYSFFYLQLKLVNKDCDGSNETFESLTDIQEIHKEVSKQSIFIVHKGNFSQEAIKPVIKMVESNLNNPEGDHISRQKVAFHLLVEILQNISKHSYRNMDIREGIFLMGFKNNQYIISTGNLIENTKIPILEKQLTILNNHTKDELDSLYKKVLREGKITEGGGAGLGLIDIARESSDKMEFCFTKIDEAVSFFSFIVKFYFAFEGKNIAK